MGRCANNFILERYPAALDDASSALDLIQKRLQASELASSDYAAAVGLDEKARTLQAKCYYSMRDWKRAKSAYDDVIARYSTNVDALEGSLASAARLKEASTGCYDLLDLFKQTREGKYHLDAADYVGPVEIMQLPDSRLGLKTTRAVKAGGLLVANKAVASVFPSDWAGGKKTMNRNMIIMVHEGPSASRLHAQLKYKWEHQPQLHSLVDRMPLGPNAKPPKAFRVADMYTLKPKDERNKPMDMAAIDRIASYAAMHFSPVTHLGEVESATEKDGDP